ncbi:Na+/H+ antiporter NhaA [Tessaracoccus oleiagri]|uniref:Na(+)/H(+) antiporter NhaA n=1 Tax=Tessaracoccus oleiagri TaxID=686624 RepID=A0A1G9HHJ6_9ACTN|nr:Na+/H+ antiporter NhaA [Tessaracoccus oleiagri]SDL12481.1 Na+:H+ antiporter, NhaA family [Tessaracoccus oleiagri]
MSDPNATILSRGTFREYSRIEKTLTTQTMAGVLLLIAAAIALIFANTGVADAYFGLRDTYLGVDFGILNLRMSIGHWAADGLLAIFFFLVGLELKRQFVVGDLRNPGRALVPMAAAFGGVAVPALIYAAINLNGPEGAMNGWAIPAATDIAFAVAILALIGTHLPAALRTFLLTLAVVDDLIAITIIAIFYTDDLQLGYLAAAIVPLVLYGFLANRFEHWFHRWFTAAWLILLPIGVLVWALFYNSGIHATIAGVVLAFLVPVHTKEEHGVQYSLSETFEHRFKPISTILAVPIFAFFSAGVAVGGWSGLLESWTSTVTLGIIAGLVVGKIIGITGTTWLITRLKHANLDPDIKWVDLIGVAAIAGIGFTVSLLIGELSFPAGSDLQDYAKVGVLTASLLASLVGAILLIPRNRYYRTIEEKEHVDTNLDGVPDVFADDVDKRQR